MAGRLRNRHHWIFCFAALAVWLSLGWQSLQALATGTTLRGSAVPALWLVPFAIFGISVVLAILLKLRASLHWSLLCIQLATVFAMAILRPGGSWSIFLVIIAWQVAMATRTRKALSWVAAQTSALAGMVLIFNPNADPNVFILGFSLVLQLLFVFTAQALRTEMETARALDQANRELGAAHAIVANKVRDAERMRISRELHDAWAHELTALRLQLEIASHVTEPGRAKDHVVQAKGIAGALLGQVRDVVSTLRETESCDFRSALEALAQGTPTPAIHVQISPEVRVGPEQAHALIRCAQEAVTNVIKHSQAANLWLLVSSDGEGVRFVARNDGGTRASSASPGSGLRGMRERMEALGGRLAVRSGGGFGFTIDAWLPLQTPQTA
jgi:signal transduction histidine kinase